MNDRLAGIGLGLRRGADYLAAALLTAMFVAFIVQIVFRYVFNYPVGWTVEVCTFAWLWGILFGSAFVTREAEEIRFDVLYAAVSEPTRRVFRAITGVVAAGLFAAALPGAWDYVTFMKIETAGFTRIRLDAVFSVYIAFTLAVIARQAWIVWTAVRGGPAPAGNPAEHGTDL